MRNNFKRIFISFGVFLILLAFGGLARFLLMPQSLPPETQILEVGQNQFWVEIADEPSEHSRGLSGRENLPENQGMFFIFPDAAIRSFWMNGMRFPLDIIWIRGDEIIGFSENLPFPKPSAGTPVAKSDLGAASGSDYPLYSPSKPADKVLEINAGLVKKSGLKIGDKLLLK